MNSFQKFLSKFLCVIIIFSGVVGGSERAFAVRIEVQEAVVSRALSDFLPQNQVSYTFNFLRQMGMIPTAYTLLMTNAGSFIEFLIRLGAIANTGISGVVGGEGPANGGASTSDAKKYNEDQITIM